MTRTWHIWQTFSEVYDSLCSDILAEDVIWCRYLSSDSMNVARNGDTKRWCNPHGETGANKQELL